MVGMMSVASLRGVARLTARTSMTAPVRRPRADLTLTTKRFFRGQTSAAMTEGSFPRSWSTLASAAIDYEDNDKDDGNEFYRNNLHIQSRNVQNPFFQQVRWKRNDGNKASTKERAPTKKQYKAYNRKVQARQQETERHGRPGSKAGPRREWIEQTKQDLLASKRRKDENLPAAPEEYDMDDALLDDLIGNTKYISSQPTPKPVYLGHKERHYFHRVADQMERYRLSMGESVDQPKDSLTDASKNSELPSDRDISLALRAYRDRNGTKQKPVGIVAALKLLLQDLGVPLRTFGENTYTTLLMCCRTPAEGRRILQMMNQQQQPVTAYSWSILIDIHAKIGDYEGCVQVIDEMLAEGVAPGLPAYTSLMAACYKVCNDGRISHTIRTKAGEVGWRKWQEMRIVGIVPDAMACGAILRLCAAQGQPEKALNLLEEMEQMKVKPTTLCFSSALRAVARSHATAIRYEQGASVKNRRREFLTAHHGKMARALVIMAENAEVDQDRGFVAALTACAAAAGDIATAKAIYVASQVRRLDQLRTVGPNSHLARLRGQSAPMDSLGDERLPRSMLTGGPGNESSNLALPGGDTSLVAEVDGRQRKRPPSFGLREYGKDSRPLSAILHACAAAVDKNGIGTMWQGRENGGYLHEDSLRLLTARRVPKYHDTSIPGMTAREVAMSAVEWDGEGKDGDFRGDKRKSRKFEGLDDDEDVGTNLDSIDEQFSRMYVDDEGRLKEEYRRTTAEDIWRAKYPNDNELEDDGDQQHQLRLPKEAGGFVTDVKERPLLSVPNQPDAEMYFDYDSMKWQTRSWRAQQVEPEIVAGLHSSVSSQSKTSQESDEKEEMYFDDNSMSWTTRKKKVETKPLHGNQTLESMVNRDSETSSSVAAKDHEDEDELYFDANEMQWKTRSRVEAEKAKRTDYEAKVLFADENESRSEVDENSGKGREASPIPGGEISDEIDEEEFAKFYEELKEEVASSGEGLDDVDEDEARELFLAMKDEYKEVMAMDMDELDLKDLSGLDLNSFKDFGIDESEDPSSPSIPADEDFEPSAFSTDTSPFDEKEGTSEDFDNFFDELKDEWREQGVKLDGFEDSLPGEDQQSSDAFTAASSSSHSSPTPQAVHTAEKRETNQFVHDVESAGSSRDTRLSSLSLHKGSFIEGSFTETVEVLDEAEMDVRELQMVYLKEMLPAFSEKRLSKIQKSFHKSLGDPSLLELIPVVRERMPDYITSTWLKQMGGLTARFVMQKAFQDGEVDVHMLNGVLELDTSSGSLDRALEFHKTQFEVHGLEPTGYSDRLVLQMFLKNNRLQRALVFKQAVEEAGRPLDIQSYGSLIDFFGRHQQLGSGVLLLKECLSVHKARPGEASLSKIRLLCRQTGLVEDAGMSDLMGEDPVEWLRHGEAKLKREQSKKGRRDVLLPRNTLLQL